MFPLQNLLVIFSLSFLGIGLIISVVIARVQGINFIGKPSVQPLLFYTSKLSIFFSIGFLLVKAIMPAFGWMEIPVWLTWIGAILALCGSLMLLISFFSMGRALKYGLPEEGTHLITTGIFRISRNPLYVGLFTVNLSSILFNPCLLNVLFSGYCIFSHIWLIRGEERFLETRFGDEWIAYAKKVRRFL